MCIRDRSTLYKLLKSLNFKFHERRRNMFICDRDDMVIWLYGDGITYAKLNSFVKKAVKFTIKTKLG